VSTENSKCLSSILQHGEVATGVQYFYDSSNYNYHRHVIKYNNAWLLVIIHTELF